MSNDSSFHAERIEILFDMSSAVSALICCEFQGHIEWGGLVLNGKELVAN